MSSARRGSRREEILKIAVQEFASRGYHGVSIDDIGAAAGVSGPALYHHFRGKEAILAAALVPVSERLLAEGRRLAAAAEPREALESLVAFHVEFALDNPAMITLHTHELSRLPEQSRREVRRLQREYVEEWVGALVAVRPELSRAEARVAAHAVFGLINSTPYLGSGLNRAKVAALLREMALAALLGGRG